ncbi:MAG TPA: CPBP family glutamic-type intramembrane protease [Pyrinomonadaceae bacterium]|nr:CPBP family glutamic-type intramembrane protease [Pyrinomonadaceae bacterium]
MSSVAKDEQHSDARLMTDTGDRQLGAWEIASVVSSILIAEWIAASVAGGSRFIVAIPITLAFAFMIVSHRLRNETLRDLGFRFDNFFRTGMLLLLPMVLVAVVCLALGRWFGGQTNFLSWHAGTPIIGQLALGFGWGLLQQYVLQGFINRRTQLIVGRGWLSVVLVAAVFSALHLPNAWLVVATFAGGVFWAAVYQRAPNLFALALSHSLMTWVIVSTLPASSLHHLRIGFKYFG